MPTCDDDCMIASEKPQISNEMCEKVFNDCDGRQLFKLARELVDDEFRVFIDMLLETADPSFDGLWDPFLDIIRYMYSNRNCSDERYFDQNPKPRTRNPDGACSYETKIYRQTMYDSRSLKEYLSIGAFLLSFLLSVRAPIFAPSIRSKRVREEFRAYIADHWNLPRMTSAVILTCLVLAACTVLQKNYAACGYAVDVLAQSRCLLPRMECCVRRGPWRHHAFFKSAGGRQKRRLCTWHADIAYSDKSIKLS